MGQEVQQDYKPQVPALREPLSPAKPYLLKYAQPTQTPSSAGDQMPKSMSFRGHSHPGLNSNAH